ncbi:MAG: nuclear transport factor 2 family protein [Chitinophagaceae bacterium]
MKLSKLSLLAFGTMLLCGSVFAQKSNPEKEVEQTVQGFTKALEDGDTAKLRAMTVEGLTYGHSSGKIQDQEAFLKALSDGSSDFVKIDISEQQIQVFGNTAVVRHILSASTNDDGKPGNVKLKILLVFQKHKKEWKLLTRQAVKFVN